MNTKQIRNVDISGIQHLPMIDFIGNDFAIFDDIRDIPFTPYPTRLNAACLAVCRKGRCRMNINLQEYEMREANALHHPARNRLCSKVSAPMTSPAAL